MNVRLALIASFAVLAAGCATTQRDMYGNPRIERASPEEVARASAPAPQPLFIEEIVRLSKAGTPPEEIMRRYAESRTRLKLNEAQKADMRRQGVDPRVLDYIAQRDADAERTDRVTAQVDRERAARRERERLQSYPPYGGYSPYYGPRVYPYFGYGWSRWGSGSFGGIGIGF